MSELTREVVEEAGGRGLDVPSSEFVSALADAAALGLSALAELLTRTEDGLVVIDGDRRYVYANPAACRILGRSIEQLRGQDFLGSFQAREHATVLEHLPKRRGDTGAPFTCTMHGPDGAEGEIVCLTFAIEMPGGVHCVAVFRDLSGPRAAARTAVALAQAAAQLVGAGSIDEILVGIARHAVEGTLALAVGIVVVGDDHKLVTAGGYGFPAQSQSREAWTAASITLNDLPGGDVLLTGRSVVLPDARLQWEASPVIKGFAATLDGLDWQAAVYVPLLWESRVFGAFGVYLPSGLAGPSESELAFYTASADQAAVAVMNSRLNSRAREAATLLERARLARELHDSVSQALFSMTMHARAAQLSMAKDGLDESGPLGRAITELGELTRGALAEMRALIFELRPAALAEEGLVAALGKQAAALSAREQVAIAVEGPEERLDLEAAVEEHLYRIVSEALHNVVKHAGADRATVNVTDQAGVLRVAVSDDGAGFDQHSEHLGHLGLSTMAERATAIGAELAVSSAPGDGTTVVISVAHNQRAQGKAASDAG